MRLHVIVGIVLVVADAAEWPQQVVQACGLSSSRAEVVSLEGALTLYMDRLCGAQNYPCRAQVTSAVNAMGDDAFKVALNEDLYNCALPADRSEQLFMSSFKIAGLKQQNYAQWGNWLGKAFKECPDLQGFQPKRSTWYPEGSGVRFLVSGTGTSKEAHKIEQCLSQSMQASSGGWFGAHVTVSEFTVSKVESNSWFGVGMKNFMILTRFLFVGLALLALYAAVAACAYFSGVKWLDPILLCWPEVCEGRGCILYQILCCPFVLIWNALRIYCCHCCHSYISWLCMPGCTKGMCWDDFEDPDFPPAQTSLGALKGDTAGGYLHQGGGTEWIRASELGGKDSQDHRGVQLFEGGIEADDILQGALGDCWLLAALACVAERPEILQQAIISKCIDPRGKYKFRLWNQVRDTMGTQWVNIVVDEYIPCHATNRKPRFAQPKDNECWALLLEKAFAKMYGGYDKLEGGCMSWALSAITGNPAVHFLRMNGLWNAFQPTGGGRLTKEEDEFSDEEFFRFLLKLKRNGAFICCSSIVPPDRKGLIDGHAYSILDMRTVQSDLVSGNYFRLVQIRNPHGQGEWKGAWSDESPQWNKYPSVRRAIMGDEVLKDDGAFWMQWEDFVVFWKDVQVVDCETNIRTVATPDYEEGTCFGPILSSIWGCLQYWLCCVGCKRLYLGRAGGKNVEEMKRDMDKKCGYDQKGFYCHFCEQTAVADDAYGSSDEEAGMVRYR
mmetsp:Transcript_105688/g.252070  ORF Transcript_105688/g.252070 Transcript_105688/m.252070 type:complete len:725 (-) Transcript_105688:108-2282(-)